jgi:hypothetical protein
MGLVLHQWKQLLKRLQLQAVQLGQFLQEFIMCKLKCGGEGEEVMAITTTAYLGKQEVEVEPIVKVL